MSVSGEPIVFEQRHVLDPARPHNRESMVWVFALPEAGVGGAAYTWVDAHGRAGAAGIAFGSRLRAPVLERVDDVPVPDSPTFERWEVGGLLVTQPGGGQDSRIEYAGERMTLSMEFTPFGVPYAYSSHPDRFPAYYADERLEQGGTGRGTLVLDGETIEFDGFCHRDHSWGARDWGRTLHYKWLNFLAPGISVHVMDLQGLGRRDVRGYVHRDGETSPIVSAAFDYDLDERLVHRGLTVTATDEAGRTTRAALTDPAAEATYPIDPRMTLTDIVGTADIDGVTGSAYAEMAWPPDYLEHYLSVH